MVEYQDSCDLGKTGPYGIGGLSYLQSLVQANFDMSNLLILKTPLVSK